MKTKFIVFLILCFNICSVDGFSQNSDTLTWYIYIGGKPDITRVRITKKVAEKWGIKTNYFYGDCGGTFDYKEQEFETKNIEVFKYLVYKYGINWKNEFDKEVDAQLAQKKN